MVAIYGHTPSIAINECKVQTDPDGWVDAPHHPSLDRTTVAEEASGQTNADVVTVAGVSPAPSPSSASAIVSVCSWQLEHGGTTDGLVRYYAASSISDAYLFFRSAHTVHQTTIDAEERVDHFNMV